MAISIADRVRIRELLHAYHHSAAVRKTDPEAEKILLAGKQAAESLRKQVSDVIAEEADDPPYRAARDRAATELRSAATAAIRRFRALVAIRATDSDTGAIVDQVLLDRAEALANKYLPSGVLSGLAEDGPALQIDASLVRDALRGQEGCEGLAATLSTLLDRHRIAMEEVTREATELETARTSLEAARARADRMRRAGWHYLQFLSLSKELPIDLSAIYPVSGRSRSDRTSEADAALDEAGAPSAEEAEPPCEAPNGAGAPIASEAPSGA